MRVDRWRRIEELLGAALERDDGERARFVERECADDEDLRREVESLLAHEAASEGFIETSAFPLAAELLADVEDAEQADWENRRVGAYRLISELGHGGMGAVFLAEREGDEFKQLVALKVMRRSLADVEIKRRFRRERQILASLNHPNIAHLLDGGVGSDGEPFLAMEYVEGTRIDDYCAAHHLSLDERLRLFLSVCRGVAYAHQHLVIHRDLKPSNILVTADGTPKLLDFGIAKLLDTEQSGESTQTHLRAFTLEYASPEQLRGQTVTTASDIYSLGVTLYELLTNTRPYRFKSGSAEEIARFVESQPPRPSGGWTVPARARTAGGDAGRKVKQGRRSLAGDLDNIVFMALRKEPERRYPTVEQFASDIERYLNRRPVLARPNTFGYRAGKFIRRNKLGVVAASLILLSVLAGLAATIWQARNASAQARAASVERDRARLEAEKSARVSEFLQNLMLAASPNWNTSGFGRSSDVTLIEVIDEAAQRINTEFADQPESLAKMHHSLGLIYTYRGRYAEGELQLRAALETSRRLYGEERPETLQHARDLAGVLMLEGEYDEADALFQKALITYHKFLDGGNAERSTLLGLAGTLSDVGFLHRLKGEPQAAEPFLRESLQQSQNFTGSERAVVAIPLAHLGMARYDQGDFDNAEKYVRQSLTEFQKLPGHTRMESGRSLLNLADVLAARGDVAQAELRVRECLQLYHRLLGDEHPYTANALGQLGELQRLEGDYAGAEETTAKSLAILHRTLPAMHPSLAYMLTTLGLIQTKRGQFLSGEKNLREALAIRERVMSEDFRLVAETKGALGECLAAQKRYADAEPFLLESYESLTRSQAGDNPRTSLAKRRLLNLYTAWGNRRAGASRNFPAPESYLRSHELKPRVPPRSPPERRRPRRSSGASRPAQGQAA